MLQAQPFVLLVFIFNNLEKMVESKGAELLAQAFGSKAKRNDQFEWQINGGSITAIPLMVEKFEDSEQTSWYLMSTFFYPRILLIMF